MTALSNLQQWVGRERTVLDELRPFPAQALAAALDRAQGPGPGEPLPPAWQWLYFLDTPTASCTGVDGHPQTSDLLPPAPLPRRMWAAGSMRMASPMRLGQPAERRSRIESIETKAGKSGALVFLNLDHEYLQDGRVCMQERQNLVYRDMPTAAAPLPPGEPAPSAADWTQTVTPDPVLLFRYSALTYNGHRIHYDRDYAVQREFYPALVVHGPLLATLLLELVHANLPGVRLASFSFRAVRPTFDTLALGVFGKRDGQRLRLWSADGDGFLCVSAEAELA
ncbi:MAG: MaoC family dehydratase N-terminal domain-containing protein [Pseudomonadota bacterium]|nr:MaoC family dehydratase N-terminal domain-containing protein [Pseudomonadota bacterium]